MVIQHEAGAHAMYFSTNTPLALLCCPYCRGPLTTKSLARSACRNCHAWRCARCSAHGIVHVRELPAAAPAREDV